MADNKITLPLKLKELLVTEVYWYQKVGIFISNFANQSPGFTGSFTI